MEKTLLIASQSQADIADVCDVVAPLVDGHLQNRAAHQAIVFTWIEVVGDPEPARRALRERPGIDDVRQDGCFLTFRGPETPEERARVAEWLIAQDVHLSGFGVTGIPAGGEHT